MFGGAVSVKTSGYGRAVRTRGYRLVVRGGSRYLIKRRLLTVAFVAVALLVPTSARVADAKTKADVSDFDGDGYADLAIAAPGETVGGVTRAGLISVLYSSKTGSGGVVQRQLGPRVRGHRGRSAHRCVARCRVGVRRLRRRRLRRPRRRCAGRHRRRPQGGRLGDRHRRLRARPRRRERPLAHAEHVRHRRRRRTGRPLRRRARVRRLRRRRVRRPRDRLPGRKARRQERGRNV